MSRLNWSKTRQARTIEHWGSEPLTSEDRTLQHARVAATPSRDKVILQIANDGSEQEKPVADVPRRELRTPQALKRIAEDRQAIEQRNARIAETRARQLAEIEASAAARHAKFVAMRANETPEQKAAREARSARRLATLKALVADSVDARLDGVTEKSVTARCAQGKGTR